MSKFIEPWGFSKLETFRACKAKFKYQFMDKLPSPSNPAMERGSKMHENIEGFLNGWVTDLDTPVSAWREALEAIKHKDFRAEQALGFNASWQKLPNWFHPETWLRVKMDASYKEGTKGTAIDFKSGKYRVPSDEQKELYAIGLHAANTELEEVAAEYWFLDTGDVHSQRYTADQLIRLRKKYETYVAPLYAEEIWKPEPSRDCRWCNYSRTKDGPCKF